MIRREELQIAYKQIALKYDIPESDFPPVKLMSDLLQVKSWNLISVSKKHLYEIQGVIKHDLNEISSGLVPALNQTNLPSKTSKKEKNIPVEAANVA